MKIPYNFRGLLYAPSTESELAILFGVLLPYLEPPMCIVEGEFQVSSTSWPDLKVKVLENKRWKSCRVEFEVKSATFVKHKHNPDDYDKIICWEDNWNILCERDKRKYKKFSNITNRISLKIFLEKNKVLNTKNFILNSSISSKSIYKGIFAKIRSGLDSFKLLKRHIVKDYLSYFKDNISFIQLRLKEQNGISVYISRRAISSLKNPAQFIRDLSILSPKITEKQKDLSFSVNSLQEVNTFIATLNKHLS